MITQFNFGGVQIMFGDSLLHFFLYLYLNSTSEQRISIYKLFTSKMFCIRKINLNKKLQMK